MNTPARTQEYVAIWHRVLGGWLSWPEPRVDTFANRMRPFIEPEMLSDRTPIFYLAHVLLPPSLRQRFEGKERITAQKEVEAAVVQHDPDAHLLATYDWKAARERVEAVLAQYGASLPRPDDLAWYEENQPEKKN